MSNTISVRVSGTSETFATVSSASTTGSITSNPGSMYYERLAKQHMEQAGTYANQAGSYATQAGTSATLASGYVEDCQDIYNSVQTSGTEATSIIAGATAESLSSISVSTTESLGSITEQTTESLSIIAELTTSIDTKTTEALTSISTSTTDAINTINATGTSVVSSISAKTTESISIIDSTTQADLVSISSATTSALNTIAQSTTTAIQSATQAGISEDHAEIWAEGTDEEVQTLGGVHSSKGWAEESSKGQINSDWAESDSTKKSFILNKNIVTDAINLKASTTYVDTADNNLQTQIDAITSQSDVTDVVGTYAELLAYDKPLYVDDIIKVLNDESRSGAKSYYVMTGGTQGAYTFSFKGSEAPSYTKSETDTLLSAKYDASNPSGYITSSSVGNGTITITQGGVTKGSFTVNQSGNTTVEVDEGGGASSFADLTGQPTDNANLATALNGKVSTSDLVEVNPMITSYVSGTSGYNIWANGYCEMWGQASGATSATTYTVNFIKNFLNTNYNVTLSILDTRTSQYFTGIAERNVSYFKYICRSDGSSQATGFLWIASGYLAAGQY